MPVEKEGDDMIAGLQIKIRGEELSRRMAQRIRAREEAIAAIDRRIARRAGDPEDDYKTIADLEGRTAGAARRAAADRARPQQSRR